MFNLILKKRQSLKETTESNISASYLAFHFCTDNEHFLLTRLYDKKDDFNFPIAYFLFFAAIFLRHLHMVIMSLS